jgi:hypothetical protein
VVNLESELGEANDNLLVIQEEFAEKYWFELEEAAE